ncbi:MAG: low molecular weight phosphotyrosine protein phosphatase [Lachnospiraceae bacterium]|nr:low molecular weight phosphotyrosine protein phosphatase [Lachnospiraceae bacterium]
MIKVLFICHGNICRSAMAEYVMKDLVKKAHREDEFEIASAATSSEELGNPMYPPARSKLAEHGISGSGHTARRMRANDYDDYDMLIGMDSENLYYMKRLWGDDPEGKFSLMMQYVGYEPGKELPPMDSVREVSDPWYTRDFEATWQDVYGGCTGLLKML